MPGRLALTGDAIAVAIARIAGRHRKVAHGDLVAHAARARTLTGGCRGCIRAEMDLGALLRLPGRRDAAGHRRLMALRRRARPVTARRDVPRVAPRSAPHGDHAHREQHSKDRRPDRAEARRLRRRAAHPRAEGEGRPRLLGVRRGQRDEVQRRLALVLSPPDHSALVIHLGGQGAGLLAVPRLRRARLEALAHDDRAAPVLAGDVDPLRAGPELPRARGVVGLGDRRPLV
jgi:hypothetical protein